MFLKVKDIYVIFSANVEFGGKKILAYTCTNKSVIQVSNG